MHNDAFIAAEVDKNVPEELVSSRSNGQSSTVAYLKGDIDADRLNEIFGPLGWDVVARDAQISNFKDMRTKWVSKQGQSKKVPQEVEMQIYAVTTSVTLRIKARTPESSDTIFTQTGVGYGEVDIGKHAKDAIAMAVKGAETDGLKRCCTLLGKAFGMFLNSDGTQGDIEYAHRGNTNGLKRAKSLRNRRERNEEENNRGSGNRGREERSNDSGHTNERTNENRDNRGSGNSDERNDRSRGQREDQNSSRGKTNNNTGERSSGTRKRPVADVDNDFDLNSEPITRDDQIAYGSTLVRKLEEIKNRDDQVDLLREYRNTINKLDSAILKRIRLNTEKFDIDIDKI